MRHSLHILVIGLSRAALSPVLAPLQAHQLVAASTLVAGNGDGRQLATEELGADALMLVLDGDEPQSLQRLVDRLPAVRPPFFVVAPGNNTEVLRAAMRAGARDVFALPFKGEEAIAAIAQIAQQERLRTGTPSARLTAFVNTRGGSGASFLATNIAYALAAGGDSRSLLVDLDYQFGGIASYLNLSAGNGLIKALELADSLDEVALGGYTQSHESGLDLLSAATEDMILPEDVTSARVEKLLSVLDGAYQQVVVDVPRRLDSATATVFSRADRVVLVAQQGVAHLYYTKRLVSLLRDQVGVPPEQMTLVLNRYDRKSDVNLDDFAGVLEGTAIETVPADHPRVTESINLGIPLCEAAAGSAIGKRLFELAGAIAPQSVGRPVSSGRRFAWFPWARH